MTESALPPFAWFYESYIGVCEEMGIELLPSHQFMKLLSALVDQGSTH